MFWCARQDAKVRARPSQGGLSDDQAGRSPRQAMHLDVENDFRSTCCGLSVSAGACKVDGFGSRL